MIERRKYRQALVARDAVCATIDDAVPWHGVCIDCCGGCGGDVDRPGEGARNPLTARTADAGAVILDSIPGVCLSSEGWHPHAAGLTWPMVTNHLLTGFTFGSCLSVVSWMVGIIGNALLVKTSCYATLSRLDFIPSKAVNKALGIGLFRWIVKNSVFRFLNQGIRVEGKRTDLAALRHRMTVAEISHLIGFLFVAAFALAQSFHVGLVFGIATMVPNALLNGYPALLQQENKRRIDELRARDKPR